MWRLYWRTQMQSDTGSYLQPAHHSIAFTQPGCVTNPIGIEPPQANEALKLAALRAAAGSLRFYEKG